MVNPLSPDETEEAQAIWADDRFAQEGADITRDIHLSRFRSSASELSTLTNRSRSHSYSWGDGPSHSKGLIHSAEIAQPGGFRRSFVENKYQIKYDFEPFLSTCLFDVALPPIQEDSDEGPAAQWESGRRGTIIGIGGGVGPAAGVALHSKILENTVTDGTDQTHFEVYHLSRSNDLPDRTRFVLGLSQRNPADGLARTMLALNAAASSFGQKAVAGVPCNTFHAPEIWSSFVDQVRARCGSRVTLVHMLEETMTHIRELLPPDATRIGVLSTTGTRQSKVWENLLVSNGYECLMVPEDSQASVHHAIYNTEWGIKAVFPISETARTRFLGFGQHLAAQGAQAIILGCTEIPLALPEDLLPGSSIVLIDPVLALSRALIREADPAKLKPLSPTKIRPAVEVPLSPPLEPLPVEHCDEEEWLDEMTLDSEVSWGQHMASREGVGGQVHRLLTQQQTEIKQLRSRLSELTDEGLQPGGPKKGKPRGGLSGRVRSFDELAFTHMQRMDSEASGDCPEEQSTRRLRADFEDQPVDVFLDRRSEVAQDISSAIEGTLQASDWGEPEPAGKVAQSKAGEGSLAWRLVVLLGLINLLLIFAWSSSSSSQSMAN